MVVRRRIRPKGSVYFVGVRGVYLPSFTGSRIFQKPQHLSLTYVGLIYRITLSKFMATIISIKLHRGGDNLDGLLCNR